MLIGYFEKHAQHMISHISKSLIALACATGLASSAFGATYHSPRKNAWIVDRSLIPLDVDMQKELSRLLTIYASRTHDQNNGRALRLNAQALAVAIAINPENQAANSLNKDYAAALPTKFIKFSPENHKRMIKLTGYLANQQGGPSGNRLSLYIKDIIKQAEPNNILVEGHRIDEKRWVTVLPPIAAYNAGNRPRPFKSKGAGNPSTKPNPHTPKPKPHTPKPKPSPTEPEDTTSPADKYPEEKNPHMPKGPLKFHQTKTEILSPMLQVYPLEHGKHYDRPILAKVSIEIHGRGEDEHGNLYMELHPNSHEHWYLKDSAKNVQASLASAYGNPPRSKCIFRTLKPYSKPNNQSISAPVAVALGASLHNKPMLPGLTVCGVLRNDETIGRPTGFWKQLKGLTDSSKEHRVIASTACEKDFKQLIAMGKPEFFILNEVVLVDDLQAAVKASFEGGEPMLQMASKLFREVQEVSQGRDVWHRAANPHVREKLSKVLELYPNHLSAKLLLLQGSGTRPKELDSIYAAWEINEAVRHITWMLEKTADELDPETILKCQARTLKELETIRKFVGKEDRDLLIDAVDAAEYIKNIARSRRHKDSTHHQKSARHNLRLMSKKLNPMLNKIQKLLNPNSTKNGRKKRGAEDN